MATIPKCKCGRDLKPLYYKRKHERGESIYTSGLFWCEECGHVYDSNRAVWLT